MAPHLAEDPLLAWAEATAYADFRRPGEPPPRWLPAIVELARPGDAAALHRALAASGGSVPAAYHRGAWRHCTALLTPRFVSALRAGGAASGLVERFELQLPVVPRRPRRATPDAAPGVPGAALRSRGELLVGAIDSAFAFAHRALRDARGRGTRVLRLWDQEGALSGACPAAFGYGREATRAGLNALMQRARRERGVVVDEAACYAAAGLSALKQRAVHGVAVLDLLAGRRSLADRVEPAPGAPPAWPDEPSPHDAAAHADVVGVQLPRDVVQDSSSAALARHLLDGLHYIVGCAGPRTRRIVVNISDGSSRGSLDGQSIIERAFEELVQAQAALGRELLIVLPSGNLADERRYARWPGLARGASAQLRLRVPPAAEAPNWVMLHLPADAAAQAQLTLHAPGGARLRARAGSVQLLRDGRGAVLGGISFPRASAGARLGLLVSVAPTADRPAAAGDWRIVLECSRGIDGRIDAQVSRNARNLGALARGGQARFVDEAYDPQRYLREAAADLPGASPIRRDGALNTLATANGVHVAGGSIGRGGGAAAFSSRDEQKCLPHVLLPVDESHALVGLRAAGALSGQTVRMRGTSFAAPQLARRLASAEAATSAAAAPAAAAPSALARRRGSRRRADP
jgi:hypothetical protein